MSQITVFVLTQRIQLNVPVMVFLFLLRTVNFVELCSTMDGVIWRYAVSNHIDCVIFFLIQQSICSQQLLANMVECINRAVHLLNHHAEVPPKKCQSPATRVAFVHMELYS